MKCPNDGSTLTMSERSGIEIDYCPECRGVWLDRGELDKLIERSAAWQTRTQPATAATNKSAGPPLAGPPPAQSYRRDHDDDDDDRDRGYGRRKRRGGFLEELFDFD